jgi:hypothetical protein
VIDAVRVALAAVRTRERPHAGELSVVELHGVPEMLIGVDELYRPHMLLPVDAEPLPALSSDVATLEVGVRALVIDDETRSFLDVTCLLQSVADVFEHFVAAVADRVQAAPAEPTRAVLDVLEKWKQFLTPPDAPVGRAKLAAVFAELLVLRDIARADPTSRIDSWVGPFGARHDFRRGSSALEVKESRAHTSREVTIHGEDQLQAPPGGTLHLHFVRLEEVPSGGETVRSIVDDLLSAGAATDRLFQALAAAGVPLAELSASHDVAFDVRERLTLPIDADTPRIVPESFVEGAKPAGVLDLNYVISLDHFIDRALPAKGFTALIHQLAGVT